ncbi:beta-N-acetylhexosaminidase [Aurantivibrio infirmus]
MSKPIPTSSALGPIMLDIDGLSISSEDLEIIRNPLVGGLIFFSRNYTSRNQFSDLVESIREVRPDLLLAVDQEGGRVQRFKNEFAALPPMQSFLQFFKQEPEQCLKQVRDVGWLMASEVLSTGVDISFAPVLDVDCDYCSVIADRSFSSQAEEVIILAEAFIDGMHEAGMATTGKHFPGHGSVVGDSHLELPVDERSLVEINARDMKPFRSLSAKLDAVMPAHIIFPKVDSSPVGFSSHWLQDILRRDLSFNGVIFSDDLSMEGAAFAGSFSQRAECAMRAGCDMVLVCNNRAAALEVLTAFENAKVQGSDKLNNMRKRKHVDLAYLRQSARWKNTVNYIENK